MTAVKQKHKASISFIATGDLLLGRGVSDKIQTFGHDYPLSKVAKYFLSNDLVLINLESPATRKGNPVKKLIRFKGNPDSIPALRRAGVTIANLANNHTLDYGHIGLSETIKHLKNAGIMSVGAGCNERAAHEPLIINTKGIKLAFLAYTAFPTYGVSYNPQRTSVASGRHASVVIRDIKMIKGKVDIVIVSFHWGVEFATKPTKLQRYLAHAAIDAGADLVIGHHSHVLQPIERYRGKTILYSLGNFVFDMTPPATRRSMILSCRIYRNGVKDIKLIPVDIVGSQPRIARY